MKTFAHKGCKIAAQKKYHFCHRGGTNLLVFAHNLIYIIRRYQIDKIFQVISQPQIVKDTPFVVINPQTCKGGGVTELQDMFCP